LLIQFMFTHDIAAKNVQSGSYEYHEVIRERALFLIKNEEKDPEVIKAFSTLSRSIDDPDFGFGAYNIFASPELFEIEFNIKTLAFEANIASRATALIEGYISAQVGKEFILPSTTDASLKRFIELRSNNPQAKKFRQRLQKYEKILPLNEKLPITEESPEDIFFGSSGSEKSPDIRESKSKTIFKKRDLSTHKQISFAEYDKDLLVEKKIEGKKNYVNLTPSQLIIQKSKHRIAERSLNELKDSLNNNHNDKFVASVDEKHGTGDKVIRAKKSAEKLLSKKEATALISDLQKKSGDKQLGLRRHHDKNGKTTGYSIRTAANAEEGKTFAEQELARRQSATTKARVERFAQYRDGDSIRDAIRYKRDGSKENYR